MRNAKWILGAVALSVLLIASSTPAASFWITDSATGATTSSVSIASGATKTLYVFATSTDPGVVFEAMLGYEISTLSSQGLGGAPASPKLECDNSSVLFDAIFPTISGVNPNSAKYATAREASNAQLGGRPFGIKAVGGHKQPLGALSTQKLFSFELKNNMTSGSSYVVLSNAGTGASYTTAWKSGSTSFPAGAYLQINTASSGANVTLTVNLQGFDFGDPMTPGIRVWVDGTLLPTTYNLNASNQITLAGIAIGTHTIAVKSSHWLHAEQNVSVSGNMTVSTPFVLANGDISGDDFVDESDFGILSGNWYLDNTGWTDPNADLNGDSFIDESDFGILSGNWYVGDAMYPNP